MGNKGRSRGKQDGRLPLSRREIVEDLQAVKGECWEKIELRNTRNRERQGYLRIIVKADEVLESTLTHSDIDEIKEMLTKLEASKEVKA